MFWLFSQNLYAIRFLSHCPHYRSLPFHMAVSDFGLYRCRSNYATVIMTKRYLGPKRAESGRNQAEKCSASKRGSQTGIPNGKTGEVQELSGWRRDGWKRHPPRQSTRNQLEQVVELPAILPANQKKAERRRFRRAGEWQGQSAKLGRPCPGSLHFRSKERRRWFA